ncbi:uncharacterized protein LOC106178504 [Lingula anatina]|uniref:Uncharacterized protein LOC106178504 n=1 Tax=Lingula anatina TaxID=7574 RepID=A0A1S3K3R6_LINAN|nr:uncharacterized protein LOC106178504 [Lingula anatina]|eukprot:XP_013417167.1 uncharacterized protein LOC106178504 [Lingula anatina]
MMPFYMWRAEQQRTMSNPEQQLHKAVRENNQTEVETLINQGVSIDCLFYNWTPLILAVQQGHDQLALWLIDKGCNIHYKDEKGESAFEEAVINNRLEVIKSLAQHGIDVNQNLISQQSALCFAAEKDLRDMAKILINNKADMFLCNKQGETPLHISIRNGYGQMVKLLVDAPQGPQLVDRAVADSSKLSPLMLAIINEEHNIAQVLIKAKCSLNAQDSDGWTALMHAVSHNSEDMVRLLLKSRADTRVCNNEGRTALQEAEENEEDEIIDLLKNHR